MSRADDDAVLRRMWAAGDTIAHIGATLGISAPTASKRANSLNLGPHPRRRVTPDRDARFRDMWKAGASHQAISTALDIPLGSIKMNLERLGLPERQRHYAKKPPRKPAAVVQVQRVRPGTDARGDLAPLPHPWWTPERDALVAATCGRYSEIDRLAGLFKRPTAEINARWLRIRGQA